MPNNDIRIALIQLILNLREDIHGDYGLPWYISMLAFKITILGIIEDQLNQSRSATCECRKQSGS
jgi:hypothetical protein